MSGVVALATMLFRFREDMVAEATTPLIWIRGASIMNRKAIRFACSSLAMIIVVLARADSTNGPENKPAASTVVVPDPQQVGGEPEGVVRVANLIYAGTKSSKCFSDHFLTRAEQDSTISTSRRFHAVKLSDNELFEFPLVIMTGEGDFELLDSERQNLRRFVERGGFLLASAGCSSPDWDRSFRAEMAKLFPDHPLTEIPMTHPIFHTVYDVTELHGLHSTPRPLEGISIGDRLAVLYSVDGLNDTAHTTGCCCCGGNEITNDEQINVNILAYALLY
jgi:hypothetical protein